MVGKERDLQRAKRALGHVARRTQGDAQARSVAYKTITASATRQLGINAGSPVFLLDDPDGDTWCMKSASLIVDPNQTYESLKDLGSRLKPAPGWKFRTEVLEQDLCSPRRTARSTSPKTSSGTPTTAVGGPFSNYKP